MNKATNHTVLLVDDDPLVLSGFREVLERNNYQVTTASTGQQAIDLLKEQSFNVVLTDLIMPRINGMDVLRAVLEHHPDSVVIMVTGFPSVRTAVEALRYGAYDYLVKPCDDHELLFRVKMGIERTELKSELRERVIDSEKMKAIAQTAVTVNDQINTPLNVILNSAEFIRLKTTTESSGVQQSLDFIQQEVTKIKSVIQRLARIADPKVKPYSAGSAAMVDIERSGQASRLQSEDEHRRRILVVDDEQYMVHTLSQILELMGYEVVCAFGGKQAYDLLNTERVDLVVSDVHMPDMNGIELLTSIKTRNPDFPVILVTGYGVDKAREAAGDCKADGFLGKPFKIDELKSLIHHALDREGNGFNGINRDLVVETSPEAANG